MKKSVWLSYDLGVDGDYDSLYQFLDEHKAKECGSNLAYFEFESNGNVVKEITTELNSRGIIRQNKDRLFLIHLSSEKKMKGSFIGGKRKSAPWIGFAFQEDTEDVSKG